MEEIETPEEEKATKVLFILRRAPHGSIYPYEGLEVMLIFAAYDQDISVAFMDDGVLALKKGQNTSKIGVKEFSKTFRALPDYDIEKLYVDRLSLEERGLTTDDLVVEVEVKERDELTRIMKEQDVVLPC